MTRVAERISCGPETTPAPPSMRNAPGLRGRPHERHPRPDAEPRLAHDFGRVRVFGNQIDAGTPPPAPAGPAQPAQPKAPACAHPGDLRKVTLQPVALRTGPDDKVPTGTSWTSRFLGAVPIWRKLGVYFHGLATVTIDTPLKTTGGTNDEILKVMDLRSDRGIEVFMVDNDVAHQGGAATKGLGSESTKILMSDRGTSDTLLAHEVGHVLGLAHPPAGADPGTVMDTTSSHSVANPTKNTMANYNRITWPASSGSACLEPDP
jgi:hypothetical protein